MHSDFRYLNKLKINENIISKVRQAKFMVEFVEHVIRFVCLRLMPTTIRAARESNRSPILNRGTGPECENNSANTLCAKRKIQTDDLTVLSLTGK